MDVDPTLLQVFLKDFPSHPTSEFPQDWELTIPSPPTPNRLGPFRPVAGSSAIYSLFRRDDGDPDSTHTKVFTLCCHIPISKPIAHPSDPEGEILDVVAMIADTGREVWGLLLLIKFLVYCAYAATEAMIDMSNCQ